MIQGSFIETFLPEYRTRHLFTTKLRVVAFVGFWVIYLFFMRDVLSQTKAISAIVCASFLVTGFAYLNVMRGKILIPSFVLEILSDLTSITAVVYLTGGPYSSYYTIYLFYVLIAGVLYNYYLAAVIAGASAIYYSIFLLLCHYGTIPPLILDYGDELPIPTYTPFAHFIFSIVFLAGIVYTVKVSDYFSQRRERILEERNRELTALHKMSSELVEKLKKLNVDLVEANRVKSEFLATMSHELRTPLTAIIGFSELLMEGVLGDMSDEQKDSLKEVLHNAADLLSLINSLLDLTKIESGKMRLDPANFDLCETVKRVLGTIDFLVQKKGQEILVNIEPGLPRFYGDERKIQQTLLNLIANANKFTPDGGKISLAIRRFGSWKEIEEKVPWSRHAEDFPRLFKNGCIEIIVEDNGMGIAEGDLEKVFEMFHQVDGSATRNFGGTGVGLSLARKFVELHGGRIWAESEPDKGAKFTAVLPIRPL